MASQVVQWVWKNQFDYASDPLNSLFSTESSLPASLIRTSRDFTITTDSYMSLCSRIYAVCRTTGEGRRFCHLSTECIPESAFQYYAVLLLWQRIAQVLPSSVKSDSTFFNEVAHIGYDPHYLPAPLYKYLQGIGCFRDPDGCHRKFVLPVIPTDEKIAGVPYTFGKVDAKTHSFYEAFPSPGIAALRIQADIKYTETPSEQNLCWDLPEGIRPDIQATNIESVKPTKNLLGWAPAKRLTIGHLNFFKSCKIDANFMPYTFDMNSVMNMFYKINDTYQGLTNWKSSSRAYTHFPCSDLNGSVVQGMTIEKHHEPLKFDRSTMYCEGNMSVRSPYKSIGLLNKSAVVSGYRLTKEPTGDRHCWSCYDFDEYKHVPQSWINSRNSIYSFGKVGRLNETVYATPYTSKKVLQNECIQRTFFECSESLIDYP